MNVNPVMAIDSFIESFVSALAPFTIVIAIWGVIAIGFFVWYLWAMARLFPRIGLPVGQGWIPLWNEWKLIDRAGLPGWVALLYLVGLGIVPIIFRTIAQHRIGRQAGVGGGYTVLGLILAPLWATLMSGLLHGQVLGASRSAAWPITPDAQSVSEAAHIPGGFAAGQFAPDQVMNPYAAPAFQAPTAASSIQPAAQSGYGAPQHAQQPTPWGAAAHNTPAAAASATPVAPVAPNSMSFAQLSAETPTSFNAETEAEYARLANEAFLAAPSTPLGQAAVAEPFSWTAASQSREADPVPEIPAPPVHPLAARPILPAAPAAPPALPVLPAAPGLPATPAFSAAPNQTGITDSRPPSLPPGHETRTRAPEQGAATPLSAPASSSGITANYNPLPPVPGTPDPFDDEFDRTVVVNRTPEVKWLLVLPDGDTLPLNADTIVGRRPETSDGATALQIPDPTRTLSKTHARLRLDGEQWTIEDLGSTNGVFLLHEDGSEQEVLPGQRVQIGSNLMIGTLKVQLRRSDEVDSRG